jgi:hypothetical protein
MLRACFQPAWIRYRVIEAVDSPLGIRKVVVESLDREGGCPPPWMRLHLRRPPDPAVPDVPLGVSSLNDENLISLMGIYASQFASYTTLLWQVPALGLTAQSFLLTIALGHGSGRIPRLIASVLSALIAGASFWLMHDQRGRAINHAALVRRLAGSQGLQLPHILGDLDCIDGKPRPTNAASVWDVDHKIYAVWKLLMILFAVADAVVIMATMLNVSWAQ